MPSKDSRTFSSFIPELCIYASLILLLIPIPAHWFGDWSEIQYIFLPLIPTVYFAFRLLGIGSDKELSFSRYDILWCLFIGLGFLSYFWATDGGRVWYGAFSWLSLFLFMNMIRSISLSPKLINRISWFLLVLFIAGLIILIVSWVFKYRSPELSAQSYLRANYLSAFLVSILPFLLFNQYLVLKKWISILLTLILIYTIAQSSSLASMLLAILVLIFFLYRQDHIKKSYIWAGLIGIILFGIFLTTDMARSFSFIRSTHYLREFSDVSNIDRYFFIRNSVWLFLENPLTGVGLNNWHIEAFKYGMEDFVNLNSLLDFRRHGAHGLLVQILAELGIFGFISFLTLILWPTLKSLFKSKNPFLTACAINILVFIGASSVYQNSAFSITYFSHFQVLAFLSLGMIVKELDIHKSKTSRINMVFLFLFSVICAIWFVCSYQWEKKFMKAIELSKDDPSRAIELLQEIYHPVYKTGYGIRGSIPLRLALFSNRIKEIDQAEEYFKTATDLDPYDCDDLMSYAEFLHRRRRDNDGARDLALRANQVSPAYWRPLVLLAQIEFEEKNCEKALSYLNPLEEREKLYEKNRQRWNQSRKDVNLSPAFNKTTDIFEKSNQLRKKIFEICPQYEQ